MIARGQVWDVNLDPTVGAEIKKTRPCVVVSSDKIGILPLKVIVPITQWQDAFEGQPWFVKIDPDTVNGLTRPSAADAFQVKSISTDRFVKQRGALSSEQMADIVSAVALVLQVP